MKIGTKSLLFGYHQIFIHPLFTFIGWVKLYGWRSINIPILLAIFFHDWGYLGCKEMDGPDGLFHPFAVTTIFGYPLPAESVTEIRWHSRHLSAKYGKTPSRLCWADKLGLVIMPSLLWALLAYITDEGWDYMDNKHGNDYVTAEEKTLTGLIRFSRKFQISIRKEIP